MATDTAPRLSNSQKLAGFMTLVGFMAVLGTLAAIAATIADRSADQRHAAWPRATAVIRGCDVERVYSRLRNSGGPQWHIECRGRIVVDGSTVAVSVRSHGVYSRAEVQELQAWVDRHGPGRSIAVRYDPDDPRSAVADPSSMPHAESRVPDDERLGVIFAVGATLLLLGASAVRRRDAQGSPVIASPAV